MPAPVPPRPATALAVAIQTRRGAMSQEDAGVELRVTGVTLSRLERGLHRPSYDTAVKLAAWLGWTVEQVMQGSSGFEPSEHSGEHSDAKPTGFEPSAHSDDTSRSR